MYRMPFVPIGLWFRLIARMITLFSHEGFNVIKQYLIFLVLSCFFTEVQNNEFKEILL